MLKKTSYLAFAFLVIFLVEAYYLPITSHQEARRALIALESKTHPLFPTLNGEPYLVKPPLHPILASPLLILGSILNFNTEAQIFLLRILTLLSYLSISYIIFQILEKTYTKP